MKTVIVTLGIIVTLAISTALAVMYTGLYNVATDWKDPAWLRWVLVTTRESSIERRAQALQAPADLCDPQRIARGFGAFRDMCAICHTLPGDDPTPLTRGLNPAPPDLAKGEGHMSETEVFWVIKNGIRMTGMPAWHPSHSEGELWDIVAFIKVLPDMRVEEIDLLKQRYPTPSGQGAEPAHAPSPH